MSGNLVKILKNGESVIFIEKIKREKRKKARLRKKREKLLE